MITMGKKLLYESAAPHVILKLLEEESIVEKSGINSRFKEAVDREKAFLGGNQDHV